MNSHNIDNFAKMHNERFLCEVGYLNIPRDLDRYVTKKLWHILGDFMVQNISEEIDKHIVNCSNWGRRKS
jgi:hypothetical protein